MKRLYRSNTNRLIAGVCGGLGEYFHIDPVIIRIVSFVLGVCGVGIPAYYCSGFLCRIIRTQVCDTIDRLCSWRVWPASHTGGVMPPFLF